VREVWIIGRSLAWKGFFVEAGVEGAIHTSPLANVEFSFDGSRKKRA
jgi:hypothetical protein